MRLLTPTQIAYVAIFLASVLLFGAGFILASVILSRPGLIALDNLPRP